MTARCLGSSLAVLVLLTLGERTAHAQTNPCNAAKLNAAGKKANAKALCHARALYKGLAVDSTCLAKAEVKFSAVYAKAEASAVTPCLTTGDAAAIEGKIEGLLADLVSELPAPVPGVPDRCGQAKWKATGKKAGAKLTCHSKAVKRAGFVDSTCLAKAEVKFSVAIAKTDLKYFPTPCAGAATTLEGLIDAAVDDISSELCTGCNLCPECCSYGRLRFDVATTATSPCGHVGPSGCVNPGGASSGAECFENADCTAPEICVGDLACNGLYFGGSAVGAPLPVAIPDLGASIAKLANCDPATTKFDLIATSALESGSIKTCTSGSEPNPLYPACVGGDNDGKPCRAATAATDCPNGGTCTGTQPGCLFGAPQPVPNANVPGLSTCIVNRIASDIDGVGNCAGFAGFFLNLSPDVYLGGDLLVSETGIQPCPLCTGSAGSETCVGGPNDGLSCTPGSSDLGDAFPTSHDCPPPAAQYVASPSPQWYGPPSYPLLLNTVGGVDLYADDTDGDGPQTNVLCGFCRDPDTLAFEAPPHPCNDSDYDCTTAPYTICQQGSDGAFGNPAAEYVYVNGRQPSACLVAPPGVHAWTIGTAFCLPPSYDAVLDDAMDLPGPAALSLPGSVQLLP